MKERRSFHLSLFLHISDINPSEKVINDRKGAQHGDTIGCSDNFVVGVIASVVTQMQNDAGHPEIIGACSRGFVFGGYACFYLGGTNFEKETGEKKAKMEPYYDAYRRQIAD